MSPPQFLRQVTTVFSPPTSRSSGAALIIVLSCLVLVAVVVVAFLTASATERGASRTYAEGGRARVLAQSAMDLVQGQIWAATTEEDTAWASQPGAIRTFRAGSTNFSRVYKLYSSDVMVAGGNFSAGTQTNPSEIPANWAERPNQFVDLNQPVSTPNGLKFPILDPRAKDFLQPANSVVGFDFNDSRGATATNLPMPVKWLYQMQDGTLGAMNDSGKIVPAPTVENPVVGRIAFWTDDDTAKININTAGEGVFWDIPRVYNAPTSGANLGNGSEPFLSRFQPAQREFQRYPGHPATVSLRTVLPTLSRSQIYSLTPRIQDDALGSNGGTRAPSAPLSLKVNPETGQPYRLLASLDELLFLQSSSGTPPLRDRNGLIQRDDLSKLGFFLTAYNRAPEVNLFGRPRVSMWPINTNPDLRTPIDKWFATCTTVGGFPFYFQRSNPSSPTADFDGIPRNQQLFRYLQALTSADVPGYNGNFLAKFGADRNQILTCIFDYIRCVNLVDTSQPVAGSTVRPFAMTNPVNTLTILTGTGLPGYYGFGQVVPIEIDGNRGFGRFPTISEVSLVIFPMSWWRDWTGALPGPESPRGVFDLPVREGEVSPDGRRPDPPLHTNARMYRALLILEPFIPAQGYAMANQDYIIRVSGLDGITANSNPIGFPDSAEMPVRGGNGSRIAGASVPSTGMLLLTPDRMSTTVVIADGGSGGGFSRPRWPFLSSPFPLPSGQFSGTPLQQDALPTFSLGGAPLRIEILSPDGVLLQQINMNFPSVSNVPTPADPSANLIVRNRTDIRVQSGFQERIQWLTQSAQQLNGFTYMGRFAPTDTVLSAEPSGAYMDLRLMALNPVILASDAAFSPQQKIALNLLSSTNNQATSFRSGFGSSILGGDTYGLLVQDLAVATNADIPAGTNGVRNALGDPGDWDAGIGDSRDGAYINKPDEGDFRASGIPYFSGAFENAIQLGFETFFAPNRQVPSPGMLGSLPTRAKAGGPWETLLFNPNPAAGPRHRGFGTTLPNGNALPNGQDPPDSLLLDLFVMPIVEPYAISEPMSTAGKINMNYQLLPFTYIERSTGVRAVLAANRVTAIHDSFASSYKSIPAGKEIRHPINATETLRQFQALFDAGRIFRSAAEICQIDLYPIVTSANLRTGAADQPSYNANRASITNWWSARRLTGDNVREQPYTNLYQNLTTQSNTYTIHVWAQAIKKSPQTPADEIQPGDTITGEYRGSYSIERFIDPNNPDLPDFANLANPNAMRFYQFRVNQTQQFLP